MPFPDEDFARNGVSVVEYRAEWADEGAEMSAWLLRSLPDAIATDHIGSTSVPGLPAKDCIDLMVRVQSIADSDLGPLAQAGYRERPEEWNRAELLGPRRIRSVSTHHLLAVGPSTFTCERVTGRQRDTRSSFVTFFVRTTRIATHGVSSRCGWQRSTQTSSFTDKSRRRCSHC